MEKETHTKGKWFSVNYGGFIKIQSNELYGSPDLLDQDQCENAVQNGILASAAPTLLKACESAILELQLLPCKCNPEVIKELEMAISKALRRA